jgi:hypothetical protein
VSTEEVLNKAYRLAYFLHQDKGMAIRIVAAATLKLNVAMAVQSKRLYYIPVGRFSRGESRRSNGIRNKALFSDLHLLQRLVYVESEPYERQKERAAQPAPPGVHAVGYSATEEDLLVYFVKHLVRITTKRNAFYVTLGVSRLLHSYSTLETMEIYNAVIGEPERVKDDYYYRSRKAVLMQELNQRFGQLIRACRRRRGEERFETQQGTSEHRSLVSECLRLFTPWSTQCPVPPDFDPFKAVIARLTSKNSADENTVEISRIHAVLHPDCYGRLIAGFGYSPPERRMELPRFFSNEKDDQSPPRQRSAPADLSAEELTEINHALAEQAGRRRRSSSAVMRIMVDGIERARLDPAEQSSISFTAGEDAELIEVKTMDASGELLLATHLLTGDQEDAAGGATVSSIRLEGGQKLSLNITRRPNEASGSAEVLVKFGYQETNLQRAASLWWQRLSLRLSPEHRQPNSENLWGGARIYILVGSVVVVCLASYLGYMKLRQRLTTQPAQTSAAQTTVPVPNRPIPGNPGGEATNPLDAGAATQLNANAEAKGTGSESARTAPQPKQRDKGDRLIVSNVPTPGSTSPSGNATARTRDEDDALDVTRSGGVVANLRLSEVKRVYIEMRGDAAFDELRRELVEKLESSGVVAATSDADQADASLKIVMSQTGGQQFEASARLVNARGVVLWPTTGRGMRRYSGDTTKVVSEIVKDLQSEIRMARAGGSRR